MTDYPLGDGAPDCPECMGRGVVDYQPPNSPVPGSMTCQCVKKRDIRANMERGWKGLTRFRAVKKSPLAKHIGGNLRVTCTDQLFRSHLHRVAFDQGSRWWFNVFSDADLMDAWLSRKADDEIYDPDVEALRKTAVSGRFQALVDLVEPPGLLILRVGVKAARNSAMPEVLLEALQHRSMVDKPTWVVDTPDYRLTEGHIAFNARVGEFLEDWKHIPLEDAGQGEPTSETGIRSMPMGGQSTRPLSLSSMTASKQKRVKREATE